MVAYVVESAASAPPPRGLPFAAPTPRASSGSDYVPPALSGEGAAEAPDEDAQPAFPAADAEGAGAFPLSGSGDEDGPSLEMLEAQMGREVVARDGAVATSGPRRAARDVEDDEAGHSSAAGPLPEIDVLTSRLPAEVRETLEELFRARFVSVKKLPKKVFSAASAKAPADAA